MTTQVTQSLLENQVVNKSVIINGDFDIWQRGTTLGSATNGAFIADRWAYQKGGTVIHTIGQGSAVPTLAESGHRSSYLLYALVTTADVALSGSAYTALTYTLEGYDYSQLRGSDATLTFWVSSSVAGIHCIGFRNAGADRSFIREYTIDAVDTWQKVTVTVPLTETGGTWDNTNGIGLSIFFTSAAGATLSTTPDAWQVGNFVATTNQVNGSATNGNSFKLAQVKFEKGSMATPFYKYTYAEEYQKCIRYYERWDRNTDGMIYNGANGQAIGTGTVRFHLMWSEKRAAPTVTANSGTAVVYTIANGTGQTSGSLTFASIGPRSCRVSVGSTGTVAGQSSLMALAVGGTIDIDAEL